MLKLISGIESMPKVCIIRWWRTNVDYGVTQLTQNKCNEMVTILPPHPLSSDLGLGIAYILDHLPLLVLQTLYTLLMPSNHDLGDCSRKPAGNITQGPETEPTE